MAKSIIRCFGCGCELQNHDPLQTGYTPKILDGDGTVLCQRCYRLQHYGENKDDFIAEPDYANIFKNINARKNLILYALDLFNFESSIIRVVHPYIKDNPILVVANKRDILPKAIDDDKLKEFIYQRLKQEGIEPQGIIVTSAYKNYNFDEIFEAGRALSNKKDIYIIGASSVGKSSIINTFLKNYKNASRNVITTSPYPGTTLKVIKVPVTDTSSIYDTPGILLEDSIFAHIDRKLIKYVMPRKEIKPRVYQLMNKQSLLIENIAKIDFIEGERSNFTVFLSNDINITRSKLENSEKVFNNMIQNKQFKLIDRNIKQLSDLKCHEYTLPQEDVDIVISGLLWVKVKGKGQKICVHTHDGVAVHVRSCKI